MPTITPFLWFATEAEDAMNLYTSIFKRSSVIAVNRAQGRTMSVVFELEGQRVMALNGRRDIAFNESFSFFVSCETQAEIDELWTKLIADGGSPSQCGWLKDRFGLSWQIIPSTLGEMLGGGGDPARAGRVMQAMLGMSKLDARQLQAAYDGP
jgi:predicted 3-demethylubiquinone-9 3-methyltransferase (glyoxalase superfamily)